MLQPGFYRPPIHRGLNIIHFDEEIVVVNKPGGLLSVPGRGENKQDSMFTRLKLEYDDVLTVHRLDMDTSGLMLFARNKQTQRQLSQLFENRKVGKKYIAIVDGRIKNSEGEINLPLICDWPNRPRQTVDHERGKSSVTRYRVIDYDENKNITRVELEPVTGRSHQLRVHMQSLGHPILGDRLYGNKHQQLKANRLLLHAMSMIFIHPETDELIQLECEPPFKNGLEDYLL